MKKRKVVGIFTYDYKKQKYESSNKPSKTIPDDTYSIQELYERYQKGLLTIEGQENAPKYELEDDSEDYDSITIIDRPDIDVTDVEEEINELKSKAVRKKESSTKKQSKQTQKSSETDDKKSVHDDEAGEVPKDAENQQDIKD